MRIAPMAVWLALVSTMPVLLTGCGGMKPSGGADRADPSAADQSSGGNGQTAGTGSAGETTNDCKVPATGNTAGAGTAVTYAGEVEAILKRSCTSCHATTAPVFDTAAKAISSGAAIVDSVEAGRMPPSGSLPAAEVETLKKWAGGGFAALRLAAATDEVTFEGQVKSIFTTKCAWCHSSAANPENRKKPYLTTYDEIRKEAEESLKEMDKGDMPPEGEKPQLESGDADAVRAWMAAGYPMGTPPPAVDTSNGVFYFDAVKDMLAASCTPCHKPGVTAPDLSTYDAAAAAGNSSLAALEGGTMPPSGALPQATIDMFKLWADAGFPASADGTVQEEPIPDSTAGTSGGTTSDAGQADEAGSAGQSSDCP